MKKRFFFSFQSGYSLKYHFFEKNDKTLNNRYNDFLIRKKAVKLKHFTNSIKSICNRLFLQEQRSISKWTFSTPFFISTTTFKEGEGEDYINISISSFWLSCFLECNANDSSFIKRKMTLEFLFKMIELIYLSLWIFLLVNSTPYDQIRFLMLNTQCSFCFEWVRYHFSLIF